MSLSLSQSQCSVNYTYNYSNTTHEFNYDLCPLFSDFPFKYEINEETPPTHTKYVYEIALGNGIKRDGTLPSDLQCPDNTFICLTVINTRQNHPSEPARVLQVVSVASGDNIRPKFRITKPIPGSGIEKDNEEDHLQLTVHGTRYMNQKQKAVFHVICEEKNPRLDFLYRWNGTHVFEWRSQRACPTVKPLPVSQLPNPDSDKNKDEGEGEEDKNTPPLDPEPDNDDLEIPIPTPIFSYHFKLWLVFLFLLLCVSISMRKIRYRILRAYNRLRQVSSSRSIPSFFSSIFPGRRTKFSTLVPIDDIDILLEEVDTERQPLKAKASSQSYSRNDKYLL